MYNTHMKSRDIIKILKDDGWYIHNIRGSHHQFKHDSKPGKVTVPHPKSDLPIGTVKNILKQASISEDVL
jgi:predicted RNA binding protein YcfA (HicA-like mRNA interferase family)